MPKSDTVRFFVATLIARSSIAATPGPEGIALRIRLILAVALTALLVAANTAAGSLAGGTWPSPVSHGRELQAGDVGPRSIGLQPTRTFAGGVMRAAGSYPFAVLVDETASYDGVTVEGPHWRIEGVRLTGGLDVYTSLPVVVRGSIVRPERDALWAIHMRPGAGPLYLLGSEAGGGAGARTGVAVLLRSPNAVVWRSHISETLDGLRLTASGHRISETLIDGLAARPKDHNDGIQTSPEARDITIERSRIENRNPQTSCILIRGGAITIRDNYLAGGGWVIYGGADGNGHGGASSDQLVVVGNVLGTGYFPKSGNFGAITYWATDRANRWSGNRFDDGTEIAEPRGRR